MILKLSEIEPVNINKKKTDLFLCTVAFDIDTYPFFIYLAKLPENDNGKYLFCKTEFVAH
jgi:hypothetical protein